MEISHVTSFITEVCSHEEFSLNVKGGLSKSDRMFISVLKLEREQLTGFLRTRHAKVREEHGSAWKWFAQSEVRILRDQDTNEATHLLYFGRGGSVFYYTAKLPEAMSLNSPPAANIKPDWKETAWCSLTVVVEFTLVSVYGHKQEWQQILTSLCAMTSGVIGK